MGITFQTSLWPEESSPKGKKQEKCWFLAGETPELCVHALQGLAVREDGETSQGMNPTPAGARSDGHQALGDAL